MHRAVAAPLLSTHISSNVLLLLQTNLQSQHINTSRILFLRTIAMSAGSFRIFETRVDDLTDATLPKAQRVPTVLLNSSGPLLAHK